MVTAIRQEAWHQATPFQGFASMKLTRATRLQMLADMDLQETST